MTLPESLDRFRTLVDIIARLRAPDGCPWDGCTSQDIQVLEIYVADINGELICDCVAGEEVSAYLWAYVYKNATAVRNAVRAIYDAFLDWG